MLNSLSWYIKEQKRVRVKETEQGGRPGRGRVASARGGREEIARLHYCGIKGLG